MSDPTVLLLSRIQFGFVMSFHIIFPAITIGLASYLAVLEGLWLWQKIKVFRDLYHFWSKIFAVNFAMGPFLPRPKIVLSFWAVMLVPALVRKARRERAG